jgi:hypothetical protein
VGVRETSDHTPNGVIDGDFNDRVVNYCYRRRRISVAKDCTRALLMPLFNVRSESRQSAVMTGDAILLDRVTSVVVVAM